MDNSIKVNEKRKVFVPDTLTSTYVDGLRFSLTSGETVKFGFYEAIPQTDGAAVHSVNLLMTMNVKTLRRIAKRMADIVDNIDNPPDLSDQDTDADSTSD